MKNLTAIAVLVLAMNTAWAKDAASIYKSKCAGCHGAQGEARQAPSGKQPRKSRGVVHIAGVS